MESLFLDCASGISGDMAVAALIDAGADKNVLQSALDSIPISGFKTEIKTVMKKEIASCDFNVILEHKNHDHDMNFLFGESSVNSEYLIVNSGEHHHNSDSDSEHTQEHHHHRDEKHEHTHENNHGHHHHDEHSFHEHEEHYHHEHRGLSEINSIIDKTKMTDSAKSLAKKIFDILADSESRAHNKPKNEIHFHEVGAVDSIVDIIAIAVCFDNLKISKVYSTPLTEGTGTVRCAHGILNIPVPAVANILQQYKIPFSIKDEHGEFVTPTGAAFVAAINPVFEFPKNFTLKKIGLGAGKREYKNPSILRAMLIEENFQNEKDTITKLECNIDDCTGENLGFVQEKLFEEGAKDVTVIPCYMKKNRPAFLLQIICADEDVSKFESIIFENTTTIGIRRVKMERTVLKRNLIELETQYGKINAKEVFINGKPRIYPEYESIKKICDEKKLSYVDVIHSLKMPQ